MCHRDVGNFPGARQHKEFAAGSQTLLALGRDEKRLGAQLGLTAVLHTWTRDLRFHPHLHCIVTGGGLSDDGQWKSTKREANRAAGGTLAVLGAQ